MNQTTISSLMFQSLENQADQLHIAHKPPSTHSKEQGWLREEDTTDPEIKAQLHSSKLAVTIVSVLSDFIFDQRETLSAIPFLL